VNFERSVTFEREEMDRSKARKWVRKAVIAMQRFWEATCRVEREILGGVADWPTEQHFKNIKELIAAAKIRAFIASQDKSPKSLEDILSGFACGADQDQISDDAWIDGIIDKIRENFRGVAIRGDEGDIVIFDP
jgi:hypothetical protein